MDQKLYDRHRDDLTNSGLKSPILAAAGLMSLAPKQMASMLQRAQPDARWESGLLFRYPSGLERVKVFYKDSATIDEDGRALPRYLSPRGSKAEVYDRLDLLSVPDTEWDKARTIFVVEGEKKCLAALQAGIPALGLMGVDSVEDPETRLDAAVLDETTSTLLAPIQMYAVRGWRIVVVFDQPDMERNVHVIRAALRLATLVREAGGEPHVAYLPREGSAKVGMDDWLKTLGQTDNARDKLEGLSRPVSPTDFLDWIDEHVFEGHSLEAKANDPPLVREEASKARCRVRSELRRATVLNAVALAGNRKEWDRWVASIRKRFRVFDAEEINGWAKEIREELSADAGNALGWLRAWVARNGVTIGPKGGLVLRDNEITYDVFRARVVLDAAPRRFANVVLDAALRVWLDEHRQAIIGQTRDSISYVQYAVEDETRRFIRALTGGDDPVDVAAARHFVWQVKRKLARRAVDNHLMPLLFGPTGCGKTRALEAFLGPVSPITVAPGDAACLGDSREMALLHKFHVVFLDEMAKINRVDIETLKNRISASDLTHRILGTNEHAANMRNNATFIGASEKPICDLVFDPLGVRRFYQITCLDRVDWETINQIAYTRIWKSVDERCESPIVAVLDDVRRRQEGWRPRDSVEEFLNLRCHMDRDARTAGRVLFQVYAEWMNQQRRPPLTETRFGRRIKELIEPDDVLHPSGVVTYRIRPMDPVREILAAHRAA